jgi:hypothetical protein
MATRSHSVKTAVGTVAVFVDRGEHQLKDVPATWHLYRAVL